LAVTRPLKDLDDIVHERKAKEALNATEQPVDTGITCQSISRHTRYVRRIRDRFAP